MPNAKTDKLKNMKEEKVQSIPIYNTKGEEVETFELEACIFNGIVNKSVIYQAVCAFNANKRRGRASTKTISDVSGGGKKPWRQKGTGRARAGSIRSPLWRGGGIIFGPHPRDFHYQLPKKIKRSAMIAILNSKLAKKSLLGIDSLTLDEPKTKRFKAILTALKLTGKTLFILDRVEENVKKASRNLREVSLKRYQDANAMDLMSSDKVVILKSVIDKLVHRQINF